jgi:hypothetical protein
LNKEPAKYAKNTKNLATDKLRSTDKHGQLSAFHFTNLPITNLPIYQKPPGHTKVFAGLSRFSLPFNKEDREVFSLSKLPQQY